MYSTITGTQVGILMILGFEEMQEMISGKNIPIN
jgi:hypothetical protein